MEAYKAAAGALLDDPSLVPRVRPWVASCPSPGLRAILEVVLDLFEDEDADIDSSAVMTALGDHPVRRHVPALAEHAGKADYPSHQLLDQSLKFLESHTRQAEIRRLRARIGELQGAADAGDPAAVQEMETTLKRLMALLGEPAPA